MGECDRGLCTTICHVWCLWGVSLWRFKCPTTIEQREQITGRDPTARLRIAVWKRSSIAIREREKLKEKTGEKTGGPLWNAAVQTFEIETGYGDVNAWIEWVKYTVQSLNHSDCYACASGWPIAQIVPCPLGWTKDSQGMRCMIALYQEKTAWGNEACKSLSLLFPSLRDSNIRVPPAFSTAIGNHTACLSRQGVSATRHLGEFALCTRTLNATKDLMGNCSRLEIPRADLWWYCGGKILRSTLPSNWGGTCALVQLAIPFTLAFERETSQIPRRSKRSLGVSFDDRAYVDSIGVPRGVPDVKPGIKLLQGLSHCSGG